MKDKEKEKDKEKSGRFKKKSGEKVGLRASKRLPKSKAPSDEEDETIDALEERGEEASVPKEPVAAKSKDGKGRKSKKSDADGSENGEGAPAEDPAKPATRLGLIRARHEAMKREIDQIREDLETEEEE